MKLMKYGLPFAALAMLASCSNDNIDQPNGGQDTPGDGSNAYLSIRLAMPAGPSGRDAEPGDVEYTYDDGSEYEVTNGKLYIYETEDDSETVGKCVMVVELPTNFTEDGIANDYLTSTLSSAKEIELTSSMSANSTYKALVILNYDGLTNLPYVGQTYDAWNKGNNQKFQNGSNNFAMTNALGWVSPDVTTGTTPAVSPEVLVTINSDNIYYKSQSQPNALPEGKKSVNIYVQRVAAKVSLGITKSGDEDLFSFTDAKTVTNGTGENADKVKLDRWYLDNVNVNSYPVQNLGNWATGIGLTTWSATPGAPLNRFIGIGTFNRVNWAEDPEYATANPSYDSTYKKSEVKTEAGAVYVLENTMQKNNMNRNESTVAVIETTYYLGGGDEAVDFVGYGGRYLKVEHAKADTPAGSILLKDLIDTATEAGQNELKDLASAFGLAAGEEGTQTVDYYKAGKSYYIAAIRHFGDTESSDSQVDMTKWTLKYPNYSNDPLDAKYLLGRFGVVRNNWYNLTINEIKGPGQPTPDPGNTPDDDPDKLMFKATINILSWVKRNQGLEW